MSEHISDLKSYKIFDTPTLSHTQLSWYLLRSAGQQGTGYSRVHQECHIKHTHPQHSLAGNKHLKCNANVLTSELYDIN